MMKIKGFVWLQRFVEKLEAKHGVTVEEAEEVFGDRRHLKIKKIKTGRYRDEHVYRALGQTEAGRHLVVFFILKTDSQVLVISARDMGLKERRSYER